MAGAILVLLLPMTASFAEEVEAPESDGIFVAMAPLNITILKKVRARGVLQVEIALAIEDDDLRHRAALLAPRLQDAYFSTLRFYTTNHLKLKRVPNVNEIANFLQDATDNVLGQKGAKVLLSQVMLLPQ